MNRDYLISEIAKRLKGKQLERGYIWEIEYQIKGVIKDLFDEKDFKHIEVKKNRYTNSCYVYYKKHYLFCLKYTKTKGESHYSYFDTHTDYFYKDFSCGDQTEDFELEMKISEIDNRVIAEELARDNLSKEMLENYKKIYGLFGDKTTSVLLYIEKHRYQLERESRNETTI